MRKQFFIFLLTANAVFSIENQLNQLFSGLSGSLSVSEGKTLAVLPFTVKGEAIEPQAGRMISEYGVVFFSQQGQFKLVDRTDFHRVIEELEFAQTDLADQEKSIALGKSLAAAFLLTGTVAEAMGKRMVSAKIIKTETGEILASQAVTVDTKALQDFYKDALGERASVSSTIYRSLAFPGWGQFYIDHDIRGFTFTGLTALSLGTLVWAGIDFQNKDNTVEENKTKVLDSDPAVNRAKKEEAEQERDDAMVFVNVMVGVTAGVWAVNLIDAAIFGAREAKRVRNLYFSCNLPADRSGMGAEIAWNF
ncbi:FlgO family outer membrane protein [Fibrobacterota bacterium]